MNPVPSTLVPTLLSLPVGSSKMDDTTYKISQVEEQLILSMPILHDKLPTLCFHVQQQSAERQILTSDWAVLHAWRGKPVVHTWPLPIPNPSHTTTLTPCSEFTEYGKVRSQMAIHLTNSAAQTTSYCGVMVTTVATHDDFTCHVFLT